VSSFLFLGVFAPKIFGVVAKKQNIRYGTINATKPLRLKGSQRRGDGRQIAMEFHRTSLLYDSLQ